LNIPAEERRVNPELRQRVAEMAPEEMRKELLASHLTGMENKRAYEEKERQPFQSAIDVDSLKWVNDTFGHEAGNDLLRSMGKALQESGLPDVYHFSGDEFHAEGKTAEEVNAAVEKARKYLADHPLTLPDREGVTHAITPGFSHGVGTTMAEAETAMQKAKQTRQDAGERAARGEKPPGVAVVPIPANAIDAKAHEAAASPLNPLPQPTEAQKEAGNYKKGHVDVQGLDISIENPAGSIRKGTDENGRAWETPFVNHYGYIRKTEGKDGDHVDAFVGPNPGSPSIFVVDQKNLKSGKFDDRRSPSGIPGQL
jgi:diguanylate cyclase (GGDEF)-like protein